MPTLFSYCIPFDDGAAPNPFWGVCTLVICKPKIRRQAEVGDWVVGTGSVNSELGDLGDKIVYAMKVTEKMTMRQYDALTQKSLREKIPDWHHKNHRLRLGDSIYDFSSDPPKQRESVHRHGNMPTDLGGGFALLSTHFFYFGGKPEPLPPDLMPIVKQGQGHRSTSNAPYFDRFVEWIENLGIKPNTLVSKQQIDLFEDEEMVAKCADCRREQAEEDERSGED